MGGGEGGGERSFIPHRSELFPPQTISLAAWLQTEKSLQESALFFSPSKGCCL